MGTNFGHEFDADNPHCIALSEKTLTSKTCAFTYHFRSISNSTNQNNSMINLINSGLLLLIMYKHYIPPFFRITLPFFIISLCKQILYNFQTLPYKMYFSVVTRVNRNCNCCSGNREAFDDLSVPECVAILNYATDVKHRKRLEEIALSYLED